MPNSIRPWQYVLEPLYGYLLLLMKLSKKKKFVENSWNFGPNNSNNKSNMYYESKVLMLNSEKSKKILQWYPKYNLRDTIKLISSWYKNFFRKKNILKTSEKLIIDYLK